MGTGALSGRNRSCGHDLGSHTRCCAFWNSVHRSARVLHGPDRTSLYLRLPSHTPPYNACAGLAYMASTRQTSETLEIRLSKVGAAEGDSSRIILAPPPTHICIRSLLVSTWPHAHVCGSHMAHIVTQPFTRVCFSRVWLCVFHVCDWLDRAFLMHPFTMPSHPQLSWSLPQPLPTQRATPDASLDSDVPLKVRHDDAAAG